MGEPARPRLVAHDGDRLRPRADPGEAGLFDRTRETGILGEEPVARVDRVGAAFARGGKDSVLGEVAFPGRRRADRERLVGLDDVPRVGVRFRIDRDRRDVERPGALHDAAGDLPAVRDQELFHGRCGRRLTAPARTRFIDGASSPFPASVRIAAAAAKPAAVGRRRPPPDGCNAPS